MISSPRGRSYEQIKANLLAEAEAVGVHVKGAPLDPVLELLINGFARELETIHARVDNALEHNRQTLLRNYFNQPFLQRPAQTVIGLQVQKQVTVGSELRLIWQRPVDNFTPEYSLLSEREMVSMGLACVFYWVGSTLYRLSWDSSLRLTSTQTSVSRSTDRPCLLLGLDAEGAQVDSSHLSFLIQPNETGLPGVFSGSDPQLSFTNYMSSATWLAADRGGSFLPERTLQGAAPKKGLPGCDDSSRFPTEDSIFGRMSLEHLYAPMVHRFEAGLSLPPSELPQPLRDACQDPDLADLADLNGKLQWVQVKFPYVAAQDPRELFSLLEVNARLAIGYRRNPRDRFNFKRDDYNLRTGLFEFGLADRAGKYCSTFGCWVVYKLEDQQGQDYPYVFQAVGRGIERWFTIEAGADDVTLIAYLPLRKVPDVGYFDLLTGHILGEVANTSQLDALAPKPANALDFPEVSELRLLVPARGGGDGYPASNGAVDSLEGGGAEALVRQYTQAAAWLRTKDRLSTLPDLESFLRTMDARITEVKPQNVSLEREGQLVSGVRLQVKFAETFRLSRDEQDAICTLAGKQIAGRLPVGLWVEVQPAAGGQES